MPLFTVDSGAELLTVLDALAWYDARDYARSQGWDPSTIAPYRGDPTLTPERLGAVKVPRVNPTALEVAQDYAAALRVQGILEAVRFLEGQPGGRMAAATLRTKFALGPAPEPPAKPLQLRGFPGYDFHGAEVAAEGHTFRGILSDTEPPDPDWERDPDRSDP